MKNSLYLISVIGCMLYYLLPQTKLFVDFTKIGVITAVIFVILSYKEDFFIDSLQCIAYLLPYLLLMFIVGKQLDFKYGFLHPFLIMWIFIFPALLCRIVLSLDDILLNKFIIYVTFIAFVMIGIQTTLIMEENPTIARAMTNGDTDDDYKEEMIMLGIGGYGFCYSAGIITICLISFLLRYELSLIEKIFYFFVLICSIVITFKALFTTLLIITFISFVIFFLYYYINNRTAFSITLIIGIILFLPQLLSISIDIYNDTPVGEHLFDLYNTTFNGQTTDSNRDIIRKACLQKIFESPIWGSDITGNAQTLYKKSHSTIFSVTIATGLIGLLSYLYTIYKVSEDNIYMNDEQEYKTNYYPVIAFFLLLALYNPIVSPEIGWTILFTIPLLFNSYKLKDY